MIYCIWYPSGGFGHFINAVLSLHGNNFARPKDTSVTFSKNGNSHSVELAAPKYMHNQEYSFDFLNDINYSVLVDNGINNEGQKFLTTFPNAKILKVCYTDNSWPVVAKTMIVKAMRSSFENELATDAWDSKEAWVKREKYFLFLRDHTLRHKWKADADFDSIYIEDLCSYEILKTKLECNGIVLNEFRDTWSKWFTANADYLTPIIVAHDIIDCVKNNINKELHTTDIWTQAVVYYYIWLEFGVEVPHNDFANWFSSTSEIRAWLKK